MYIYSFFYVCMFCIIRNIKLFICVFVVVVVLVYICLPVCTPRIISTHTVANTVKYLWYIRIEEVCTYTHQLYMYVCVYMYICIVIIFI